MGSITAMYCNNTRDKADGNNHRRTVLGESRHRLAAAQKETFPFVAVVTVLRGVILKPKIQCIVSIEGSGFNFWFRISTISPMVVDRGEVLVLVVVVIDGTSVLRGITITWFHFNLIKCCPKCQKDTGKKDKYKLSATVM